MSAALSFLSCVFIVIRSSLVIASLFSSRFMCSFSFSSFLAASPRRILLLYLAFVL